MALLPEGTVRAYVAEEMKAAQAWADRQSYDLTFDEEHLAVSLPLDSAAAERYLLKGTFVDYRAVPPAWWFVHTDTGGAVGPPAFPAAPNPNPRGSTLFITGPTGAVICAHFNRLAFAQEGGPHGDWGPPTNWLNAPSPSYTCAETIADMLARIDLEVRESAGRMAPLP